MTITMTESKGEEGGAAVTKGRIRKSSLRQRRAMPRLLNAELSAAIQSRVFAAPEFSDAKVVACYVAKEDEVQTAPIIERALSMGKEVVVPVVDLRENRLLFYPITAISDLSPGYFGVLEPARRGRPVALTQTDLVLVPLAAWDERGQRIGYGRGYFDRVLAARGGSVAAGLAFESQRVERVPNGPSDVGLDMMFTEKRVLRFANDGVE